MKMLHSEWEGRLNHWIHTLTKDFYEPLGELEWTYFRTMDRIEPKDAARLAVNPAKPGLRWGRNREYAWFKTSVEMPKEAAGKRIVLNLEPGGESTLFVNGRSFGTYRASWLGTKHQFYSDNALTENAAAGERFDILMETYAGHDFPESELGGCCTGPVLPGLYEIKEREDRCTLGKCTYGIWNEDCYQLYMDVMTLRSLLKVVDNTSLRAAKIAEALENFTLIVDFEQGREERIASYRQAREALKEVLSRKNGDTVPRFFAMGHAHLDLVWLWPIEETRRKTSRTFAAQLRLLDEYPEYRFIQSQPAEYEMCRKCYPELFERIKEKIKTGQWIADGAMWVEPDTNMSGGEALVRQVLYGKKYYKEVLGTDSETLWLPDTFGYSAVLPQILKKTGVKYLVTQKIFWTYNEGEEFPYHYFRWRGMDGSEITTFLPTSYGYETHPESLNRTWKERRQARNLEGFLIPFGYGDGGGGPARDHIEYALRQKDLEGSVKVEMASPVEFFEEMDKLGGPKETWDGELYFTAHRGTYTSQAAVKKFNRTTEKKLRELEMLYSRAISEGIMKNELDDEIEEMWKELLTFQFHDILPGSSIKEAYEYVEAEFAKLLQRIEERIEDLAGRFVKDSEGITVFNSLSRDRKVTFTLPENFKNGAETAEGKGVTCFEKDGRLEASVTVPAFGNVTLIPSAKALKAEAVARAYAGNDGFRLENDKVSVLVNKNGEIVSYVLKENGMEYAKAPMNRLRLFKSTPRLFDAWDIDSNYEVQECDGARDVVVAIERSEGLTVKLSVSGKIGVSEFRQTLSLTEGDKVVRIDTDIDWKELHRILKASFPVNVLATEGINEIQFGFVKRPTHRSRLGDKDKFEVCNHRYSALCDGSHGAAVLNDCKYGIGMKDSTLELTLLTAAASPEMRADNRKHSFSYGFMGWAGSFEESDVVEEGYRFNIAPVFKKGSCEEKQELRVSEKAVTVEAVKTADDRSGDLVVRLYEAYRTTCTTRIEGEMIRGRKIWLCDLLENKEEEVFADNGELTLNFTPFEIKTLRIEK